jgi:hypothetical protein
MSTNDPSTDLATPVAAWERAEGSRRARPVMSWKQKNSTVMNTAMPNRML